MTEREKSFETLRCLTEVELTRLKPFAQQEEVDAERHFVWTRIQSLLDAHEKLVLEQHYADLERRAEKMLEQFLIDSECFVKGV